MSDPHEARQALGLWFVQMLEALDDDRVEESAAVEKLKGMVAEAFARWHLDTGDGVYGLPSELPAEDEPV